MKEEVKLDVMNILEAMCGVAEGARVDNVDLLFSFFSSLLNDVTHVLGEHNAFTSHLFWFGESLGDGAAQLRSQCALSCTVLRTVTIFVIPDFRCYVIFNPNLLKRVIISFATVFRCISCV